MEISLQRKTEDLDRMIPQRPAITGNTPFAGFNPIGAIPGVTSSSIGSQVVPSQMGEQVVETRENAPLIPTKETFEQAAQFREGEQVFDRTGLSQRGTDRVAQIIEELGLPEEQKAAAFEQIAPIAKQALSQREGTPEYDARQQQKMQNREDFLSNFNLGFEIGSIDKLQTDETVQKLDEAIKDRSFGAILDAPLAGLELGGKTLANAAIFGVNTVGDLLNIVGNPGDFANSLINIGKGAYDIAQGNETPESEVAGAFVDSMGSTIVDPIRALVEEGDPKPIATAISENPGAIIEIATGLGTTRAAGRAAGKVASKGADIAKATPAAIRDLPGNIDQFRKGLAGVDESVKTAAENITRGDYEALSAAAKSAAKNDKNLGAVETVVNNIEDAVETSIRQPKREIGKQLGEIRENTRNLGKSLDIDTTDALSKMEEVLQRDYNVKPKITVDKNGKSKLSFEAGEQGSIGKLAGEESKIMADLYKDISNAASAADIDAIFDKANDVYSKYLKSNNLSADGTFMRAIGDVRASLDGELSKIFGNEYKQLRQEYKKYAEMDTKFTPLFSKKTTGVPGSTSSTIASIKKIFSPDKGAVVDRFKELEEVTGVDFISQSRVAKFLDESSGNRKVSSLLDITPTKEGLVSSVMSTLVRGAADLVS